MEPSTLSAVCTAAEVKAAGSGRRSLGERIDCLQPNDRRLPRASKLASHSMNHRAPKFDSFLTRVHRHLPCDARLVSRWLFLFRAQWRSLCLCRAERHSKVVRFGFLYPADRRGAPFRSWHGTPCIRGRPRARAGPTAVSGSVIPTPRPSNSHRVVTACKVTAKKTQVASTPPLSDSYTHVQKQGPT